MLTTQSLWSAWMSKQHIYVNDPAFPSGPLTVDRGEFDLAWLEWDEKYAVLTSRD